MAAQENHADVVKYLLANNASQTLATEVCSDELTATLTRIVLVKSKLTTTPVCF